MSDSQDLHVGQLLGHEMDASQTPPETLPVLPITTRPFFPEMAAPITIDITSHYYPLLKALLNQSERNLALLLTKDSSIKAADAKASDLYSFGVQAKLLRIIKQDENSLQALLHIQRRLQVNFFEESPQLIGHVQYPQDQLKKDRFATAYFNTILTSLRQIVRHNPFYQQEMQSLINQSEFTDLGKLADISSALTSADRMQLQKLLETLDIKKRAKLAIKILKNEEKLAEIQSQITEKIDLSISQGQREYVLRQQLETIQKELGDKKDAKSSEIEKFRNRIKNQSVPPHALAVIEEELARFESLEVHSAEFSMARSYLDWLTQIPWGTFHENHVKLRTIEKKLNRDHYGLEDVKSRILEFMSVSRLTQENRGSILCFIGPPGVGKTSVGLSIAKSLGRPCFRFSVGGMRDEAEIKGHRRTYVGAMPGKFIQALKQTKVMNPVIIIDEVDKLIQSYHGDPASALLEVLDKEQNHTFLDHFIDLEVDLSHALFILTANVADTIPQALKDRLEFIEISGYTLDEKVKIAQKYLIPKHTKQMGLSEIKISFPESVVRYIIHYYARESGVRSLEKAIEKILRKRAYMWVKDQESKKELKSSDLKINITSVKELLGLPKFHDDPTLTKPPLGVATGLAWTAVGGCCLSVETIKSPTQEARLELTGQAGDVMKESSSIAYSYIRSYGYKLFGKEQEKKLKKYFDEFSGVHMHIPEGATPKDGPSAGITMACAILSLFSKKKLLPFTVMSGELTLNGHVLAVGGIKEKIMAACRCKCKRVILPEANRSDFFELPPSLTKQIEVIFVKSFPEVVKHAF